MSKYIRIKNGECSFILTEEFDSVEKAANGSNNGTNAEVKIDNIKVDFTTVKKEQDDGNKKSSTKADGQAKEKEWVVHCFSSEN